VGCGDDGEGMGRNVDVDVDVDEDAVDANMRVMKTSIISRGYWLRMANRAHVAWN